MKREKVRILGYETEVISLNTVVVGTGCAGYNGADWLYNYGCTDVAIVTEGINRGTSRNTGSDKQTYYKLSQGRYDRDSIYSMAETLFSGGLIHGDIALIEAASSLGNFYKLVNLGVPFPCTVYGEYIGYKTDHDPYERGTSCGPLTSKFMTEKLEQSVLSKGIKIYDGYLVIKIITSEDETKRSRGLLTLDIKALIREKKIRPVLFNCTNIIYATGGPGGIYGASVYPESQSGALGAALEAGVSGVNLTESQFGIGGAKFRWNLSGTYQQVLPRYVSMGPDGVEREFLNEYFDSPQSLLNAIFLKGYQWPFDPAKIKGYGSSLIDILVYNEISIKKRDVFLDYTKNPLGDNFSMDMLGQTGKTYLEKSGALLDTPILRLEKMNSPAIDLFRENKTDLHRDYLPVNVCAQHMNGGLKGNIWWESNVKNFFPVGEANGTFGIYRPGGSALNSTQTGSKRAARYISEKYTRPPLNTGEFLKVAEAGLISFDRWVKGFLNNKRKDGHSVAQTGKRIRGRMSLAGGHIREYNRVMDAMNDMDTELKAMEDSMYVDDISQLADAFKNVDMAITCKAILFAIKKHIDRGGKSRGSYLVYDKSGTLPSPGLPELFRYSEDTCPSGFIDEITMDCGKTGNFISEQVPVRPIPEGEDWFENVWNSFMKNKNIL